MSFTWFNRIFRKESSNPSTAITHIYIAGWRGDFEFTKCCVASIRHWYPLIPITLIKDRLHGDYDTSTLERAFQVRLFPSRRKAHGYGFAKLEPLFLTRPERFLILDSDTVFLGPLLARLERIPEDFVVPKEDHSPEHIRECYFDPHQLQELYPDFEFPGYTFNTGHLVARAGRVRRSDFAAHIEFPNHREAGHPPRMLRPDLFLCGEQGLLNFLLLRLRQQGRITLAREPFTDWPPGMRPDAIDLQKIRHSGGYDFLLHWAGVKQHTIRDAPQAHVLNYFREIYRQRTGE